MDQIINIQDITAEELKKRINQSETIHIIDVREPYEYEEINIGAILIPLGDIQNRLSEINELKKVELIIHCRTGARSAAAKVFLMQHGFINVRSLLGGIIAYQALENKD